MIYALLVFIALQIADAGLTVVIIRAGGRELNPAVRVLIERLGLVPGLVAAKALLIALVLACLPIVPLWALIALDVLYMGVVGWNATQL